jgi:hypothetical protein
MFKTEGMVMKSLILATCAVIALIASEQQARADILLQDFAVNVNGTVSDYNNLLTTDPTTLSGMNATGYSTSTTGDGLGTGLGTLVFTYNPGPGSYFVNFLFDLEAGTPFYNEYGVKNGSPAGGTTWQIAAVPSTLGTPNFVGTVFGNALDNTNHVPAGNSNFSNSCTVVPCNADVAEALRFDFTLAAGQEAVITVNESTTNPGGFNLQQVHPPDGAPLGTERDVFLNGSVSIQPAGVTPVPEPNSLVLLGPILAMLGVMVIVSFRKSRGDIEKHPGLTS